MIWESPTLKEYITISVLAVKPWRKYIQMENINGFALDELMLNMNCQSHMTYMTRNAKGVRGYIGRNRDGEV
jgi:hypothetical protein